ncbi:hypothetical protein [Xanthobacter sediminis]|uniref:hypothetical protein n=1 Tax=Xanthobacter sediminis TaxID=3119926 RepID=UPI0037270A26
MAASDDLPVSAGFYHRDMEPAAPVADAAGSEDVVTQLNALLAALRAAGILAPGANDGGE